MFSSETHAAPSRSNLRRIGLTVGAAALVVGLAAAPTHRAPARSLERGILAAERFVGSPAVISFGTADIGPANRGAPIAVDVVLAPRDGAALSSFATAVSTPGNRLYRHFLDRGQFASRFGPTSTAIATVRRTLRNLGLEAGAISTNHLLLSVETTVGKAESAFGVKIDSYRLPSGRVALANKNAPSLPAAAARFVTAIVGLDNLHLAQPATASALPTTPKRTHNPASPGRPTATGPQPCTAARQAASSSGGWTDDQLARAYSLPSLYSRGDLGNGATIALYELTTYSSADVASYQACFATHTKIANLAVDGGATSSAGAGEAELDIEVVLGLAPSSSLLVYEAPNTTKASLDEYSAIASQDKAQVISSSWGQCELFLGSTAAAENTIFKQMAAQGQSMISIPGDEGSQGCLPNDFGVHGAGLPKGSQPAGIAVDPSDLTAYVANVGNGTLSVVNEANLFLAKTINLGSGSGSKPIGVAVDPVTHQVFVTEAAAARIAVIAGATCNARNVSNCGVRTVNTGTGSFPLGIAVDHSTNTVYFVASGFGQLGVMNESTGNIVDGTPPPNSLLSPSDVAIDVAQNRIFYTDTNNNAVGGFAGGTCDASNISGCAAPPGEVAVGTAPGGLTVDSANQRVYVSNFGSSSVSVVTETGTTITTIPLGTVGFSPELSAISPSGTALLVPCAQNNGHTRNGVVVISLASDSITSILAAGGNPVAVASDPAIDFAVASDQAQNGVISIPLVTDPWDPGTQPFVTGVGGTDLTALGPKPTESVWDEHLNPAAHSPEGGGGGGISFDWAMPAYQSAPGVKNPFSSGKPCGLKTGICREVPDVSASADPAHGYVVFEQGKWIPIGGTSAAAPLWAAIVGLLDVQQGALHKIGFINPALYRLVSAKKLIVNDVTVGNNDYTTTAGGRFPATAGYDMATGLGTPITTGLSMTLAANPRPTVTSLSSNGGSASGGTAVKIVGSGFLWTTSVHFGSKAAASVTVVSPTEILATSPSGSGPVTVTVTTPGGTSAASTGSRFTY